MAHHSTCSASSKRIPPYYGRDATMVTPPKLYKYQPVTEQTLANLCAHRIWLSQPSGFNDPLDCALQVVRPEFTDQEVVDVVGQLQRGGTITPEDVAVVHRDGRIDPAGRDALVEAAHASLEAERRRLADTLGIGCFSACIDEVLMWSHYANGHRGICLEFSTDRPPFSGARQVQYVEHAPDTSPAAVLDPLRRRDVATTMLLTKHTSWAYEREWRIIESEGSTGLPYEPDQLTAVYLGFAMPEDLRTLCVRVADPVTKVYAMDLPPRTFRVRVGARLGSSALV